MLQMITKGSRVVGVLDGDKLHAATPLLRKWFTEGVPALRPKQGGTIKTGRTITEFLQTVAPEDPLFGLAFLDALEDQDLELVRIEPSMAKAAPPVTNVGGGQTVSGIGGGANLQMELPAKPHNPHDVAGVREYLTGMKNSPGVTVTRDPSIYEIDAGIDWVFPIADAIGNVRNSLVPDETENRAKENKAMIERTSKQDRMVPGNTGQTTSPAGQWHPVQREGAPRYPGEDDSARTIKTPVRGEEDS